MFGCLDLTLQGGRCCGGVQVSAVIGGLRQSSVPLRHHVTPDRAPQSPFTGTSHQTVSGTFVIK